jgi:transposase InsO family protein
LQLNGEWRTPILFGVLDDHSRLACHLQWYLAESAANIAHGLSQAMQKRGLPRAAISDKGSAMTAAEISEGLARLGIRHQTTLPYSPYENGKQEVLWGSIEGRLMAMLEGIDDLTLGRLNPAQLQRGDASLGRAGLQPQATQRDRRHAARTLPRWSCGDASLPGCRRAAVGLHPHRAAYLAQERCHHRH